MRTTTNEYTPMGQFTRSDVAMLSCFWAHPESGRVYHIGGSHTDAAIDPNGPMSIELDDTTKNDFRVFEIAFRAGWIRAIYLPANGNMASQVGLHGADEKIVRDTLRMLLASGLDVASVGLQGHYDGYDYSGEPEGL